MTINHNGYKIWKASSDGKDEKVHTFRKKIILTVIIVCIGLFFFSVVLDVIEAERTNDTDHFSISMSKASLTAFAIILCIPYAVHKFKQNPKRYAFIKSPYGEVYIIDYNYPFMIQNTYHSSMGTTTQFESYFMNQNKSAQQIDMINRMNIFENLADQNMIMPFGKKIMCVHSLKSMEMGCYLNITTTDNIHPPKKLRIFLPDNYPDLDELIMHLETLKTSH